MNERIKQLSDIAYKNHLKNNPESSFGRRIDYDKEFAELIVRECINYCGENLSKTVGVALKIHFGMEYKNETHTN